jgi:hypothetical protein
VEAEEELAKETIRAFKAGLHGEEYENPFTEAEEARDHGGHRPLEPESHEDEDGRQPA